MSTKIDLVSEQQAEEFLAINSGKYEALTASLYELFDRIFDTLDAEGRIYRIYSRSDKQRGKIFKDAWKIQYKINKARRKNNSLKIEEIGDIIGMTIVVPYPSDQTFVREIIDSNIDDGKILSFTKTKRGGKEVHGEPKGERGYHAHHYELGLPHPDVQDARCEVQVKTLLHDAWAA
ncbi:MAG: RelA/SpoT domain-containing protein, partial [Planctomycetota bacterium]